MREVKGYFGREKGRKGEREKGRKDSDTWCTKRTENISLLITYRVLSDLPYAPKFGTLIYCWSVRI
jgi:hypothetical protein